MERDVYVADSVIHGKGLFASRKFENGEKVIEYLGERITEREYKRRYPDGFARYGLEVDGPRGNKIYIDAIKPEKSNEARYANDAHDTEFENNTIFVMSGKKRKRAYIVASRDIKPGEEILVDYGSDYWS
jgi:uncharacterized protein